MTQLIANEKGFTLVEVLVAIVILAIGVLATTKLQLSFIQGNAKARYLTEGSAMAQTRIEELMGLPYADVLLSERADDLDGVAGLDDATDATADHSATEQFNASASKSYKFFWNIAPDAPEVGLKTVNVIVQWPDEKNIQRQVNYTFIKGNI